MTFPHIRKLALLSAVFAATAFCQDIAGSWQGTMQIQQHDQRMVAHISKGGGDAFRAVFYNIDQSNQGFVASAVTIEDGTVKMILPGIGGSYEGKLNAAGNQITGTFRQFTQTIPLDLNKATADTAWAIPAAPAGSGKPMAANADPVFEVATIKPTAPDFQGIGIGMRGRTFTARGTSVTRLLTFEYGVRAEQIIGAPAWMETEKFDLEAQPDTEGVPNLKQIRIMLAKLLADRFQLKFHRDKKVLSVYTLTELKTGNQLTPTAPNPDGSQTQGAYGGTSFQGPGRMVARNVTIADFIGWMETTVLARPIVDQTGLTGLYDFTLNWHPDQFQFAASRAAPEVLENSNTDFPDLYTAIQKQLGLKLEAAHIPAEVLVIDHVEKPDAN